MRMKKGQSRIRRRVFFAALAGTFVFLPHFSASAKNEDDAESVMKRHDLVVTGTEPESSTGLHTEVRIPGEGLHEEATPGTGLHDEATSDAGLHEETPGAGLHEETPETGLHFENAKGFEVREDGFTYFINGAGMPVYGFFEYQGELYYADNKGHVRTTAGWFQVSGAWYYSGQNGSLRRDSAIWSGGTIYYAGSNGALTGGVHPVGDTLRFFNKDGEVVKKAGWLNAAGGWYYLKENGIVTIDSVIMDDGIYYYAGEDGKLTEAVAEFDGKLGYFDKNGKLRTKTGWVSFNGDWYFTTAGGELARNRIVGSSGNLYYMGSDGKLSGGVHELDGTLYYFLKDGSLSRKKGWLQIDGEWYYGEGDGTLRKNDGVWSGGSLYYVGETGTLTGGIHKVGNSLRYFDGNGEVKKVSGWKIVDGHWCYIDQNGVVYSGGKYRIGDSYYYFDENGFMKTGLIKLEGVMYYASRTGELVTSRNITIEDSRYYANETGEIAVGTMYKKAQAYSSDTNYLILVNISTQKTAVFKGSKDNWLLLKEFSCSTGSKDSPTPTGEYKTTVHDKYFDSHGWRCWYATGFIGGLYLFHSQPYLKDDAPNRVADATIGKPSSHGCVRLKIDDAKWMYDTLPLRTKVVIFK